MSVYDNGFEIAFPRLIGSEGGYTNNPRDPGNWTGGEVNKGALKGTKYGISAESYPHLDIKNLTLADVKPIYYRDYWLRCGCDAFHAAIAFQVFDAAVNHGPGNAARFLQRAVGVADDGKIGPITKSTVNSHSVTDVLMGFNAERLKFYTKLSTWPVFGKGWTARVAENLLYGARDT